VLECVAGIVLFLVSLMLSRRPWFFVVVLFFPLFLGGKASFCENAVCFVLMCLVVLSG